MFPFERPKDYNEMLNKIGLSTFFLSLGLTWVVATTVPDIARVLDSQPLQVEVLSLHLKILYVMPAMIIALFARIVRLHNWVSNIFGIRAQFDLYRVLIPLCGSVGLVVDRSLRDKLALKRSRAMQSTFYEYASFEDPRISKALVLSAIEVWTWYWILLELIVLIGLADTVLLITKSFAAAAFFSLGLLVSILLFLTCFQVCGKKADAQIEQITSDLQKAEHIRIEIMKL